MNTSPTTSTLRSVTNCGVLLLVSIGLCVDASAKVIFPSIDGSFVLANETGTSRASRSYGSTEILIDQALLDASEFRFTSAVTFGTSFTGVTTVQGLNVLTYSTSISLFESIRLQRTETHLYSRRLISTLPA